MPPKSEASPTKAIYAFARLQSTKRSGRHNCHYMGRFHPYNHTLKLYIYCSRMRTPLASYPASPYGSRNFTSLESPCHVCVHNIPLFPHLFLCLSFCVEFYLVGGRSYIVISVVNIIYPNGTTSLFPETTPLRSLSRASLIPSNPRGSASTSGRLMRELESNSSNHTINISPMVDTSWNNLMGTECIATFSLDVLGSPVNPTRWALCNTSSGWC